MVISLLALCIGFVLDLCIGDPHKIPHPVCFIGKFISWQEKHLRKLFPHTKQGELLAGGVLVCITVTVSSLLPFSILLVTQHISPYLRLFVESIMCWQILATKSLKTESMKVYSALAANDLNQAKRNLSMIVGRDTANLDTTAVSKATIETVAENTSDGVVAPLFFCALGGATAGFFYKSINTLDSMVAYKNERYLYFGRIAAKLDDIANYLPSRITALLMILSAAVLGFNPTSAYSIWQRDKRKHASPNAAQTESACAGALEIQLAGDAFYQGVLHKKDHIGDDTKPVTPDHIIQANQLLYMTALLSLLCFILIKLAVLVSIFLLPFGSAVFRK